MCFPKHGWYINHLIQNQQEWLLKCIIWGEITRHTLSQHCKLMRFQPWKKIYSFIWNFFIVSTFYCIVFISAFFKAASFHNELSVCLVLWFEFPRNECFFCKLSYQCHVSTLEAQEACWQTNRMIKMSQTQVFSFILNNSHCLPQTSELQGQVRPPRSGWARGMTRARETC